MRLSIRRQQGVVAAGERNFAVSAPRRAIGQRRCILFCSDMSQRFLWSGLQIDPLCAIDLQTAVQTRQLLLPMREFLCWHCLFHLSRRKSGCFVLYRAGASHKSFAGFGEELTQNRRAGLCLRLCSTDGLKLTQHLRPHGLRDAINFAMAVGEAPRLRLAGLHFVYGESGETKFSARAVIVSKRFVVC